MQSDGVRSDVGYCRIRQGALEEIQFTSAQPFVDSAKRYIDTGYPFEATWKTFILVSSSCCNLFEQVSQVKWISQYLDFSDGSPRAAGTPTPFRESQSLARLWDHHVWNNGTLMKIKRMFLCRSAARRFALGMLVAVLTGCNTAPSTAPTTSSSSAPSTAPPSDGGTSPTVATTTVAAAPPSDTSTSGYPSTEPLVVADGNGWTSQGLEGLGRGPCLSTPSHTTGHAGPHPAVRHVLFKRDHVDLMPSRPAPVQ